MKKFKVYYMRPEYFSEGIGGHHHWAKTANLPKMNALEKTHVFLGEFEAEDIDGLFEKMQAENWSPNGEAKPLIRSKGLRHTSMSVGDIVIEDGKGVMCDMTGWFNLDP